MAGSGLRAGVMGLAILLGAARVQGELPGLPAAQGPGEGPGPGAAQYAAPGGAEAMGEGARPGEGRPAAAPPTGPVRGSLFKQAVDAPAPEGYNPASGIAGGARNGGGGVSFIAVAPAQPKSYRKNDVLTVVISEISDAETNSQGNSKKTQDFDLALQQFVQLALSQSGVPTVATVNNPSKLPEVKFNFNNDRQSTASQQRSDSFTARVSATVVDVKPNGTLVIEAVKQIYIDKEIQIFKLSGICRVADIAADNTILSTQLANLTVSKQTSGEVRDGTRSGWLNQWIDKWNPF